MCGRFGLFTTPATLAEQFDLAAVPAAVPARYNVTPGQGIAAVRDRDGRRTLDSLQWGLVPFWAKDRVIGRRLINARFDSIAVKPAFREAWARRRCLIPVSGFYEWSAPSAGRKRPFFIGPFAAAPPVLALAGLWERWRTPEGETLETCVIVTTEACAELASIHDRMPLVVPRAAHAVWLDPRSTLAEVAALAHVPPRFEVRAVGLAVNDPKRDDASLIEPCGEFG